MLHIILLLLKIIGILLLCVLGLILLILMTTMLVPIRYRVAAKHGEKLFYLKGRVNWLLHIVHLGFSYIEGELHITARLFGFIVYDNLKPRKPKKPKKIKEAKKKSAGSKNARRKSDSKPSMRKVGDTSSDTLDLPIEPSVKLPEEDNISKESIRTPITTDTAFHKSTADEKERERGKASTVKGKPERKSLFQKLLEWIRRIKDKIISIFQKWKAKISQTIATVSRLRHRLDLIVDFLRDELNKEGMHITFSSIKRLIKHILPTKLSVKLTFGTGDPCSTGQALGALSILYSFYGDKIQITPDFERSVLEGEYLVVGRIRLVSILIIVVKLILDKRFKQLKNNFMILKEAL